MSIENYHIHAYNKQTDQSRKRSNNYYLVQITQNSEGEDPSGLTKMMSFGSRLGVSTRERPPAPPGFWAEHERSCVSRRGGRQDRTPLRLKHRPSRTDLSPKEHRGPRRCRHETAESE